MNCVITNFQCHGYPLESCHPDSLFTTPVDVEHPSDKFGGPATSSFSLQRLRTDTSPKSPVSLQPSLFPIDYSSCLQNQKSPHPRSPQALLFAEDSSNYQNVQFTSSEYQQNQFQLYSVPSEDPLLEGGISGLTSQPAASPILLNKKNEPRQRQPKKSRHSCSPQEYAAYQREQVREQCLLFVLSYTHVNIKAGNTWFIDFSTHLFLCYLNWRLMLY